MQRTVAIDSIANENVRRQVKALVDLGGTATSEELMTVLDESDSRAISSRFTGFMKSNPGALAYDKKRGYTWVGVTTAPEKEAKFEDSTEMTQKQIVALINLGGTATAADIAKAIGGNDRRVIRNRFISFNKSHPNAIKYDSKTATYTWMNMVDISGTKDKPVEKKEEKKIEEPVNTNSSYSHSDPTMSAALRNIERSESKCKAGDIWEYDKPYYGMNDTVGDKFLVINAFKGTVTCMLMVPVDSRFDPKYDISISHKSKMYYVDTRRVTSKAEKGFVRRVDVVDETLMNDIRALVSGVLKLGCVVEKRVEIKVPVEKIVTKEVPVEKIVEVPVQEPGMVYISEIEYELLKQRADLWQTAFVLMSGRAS